jgi:riboflavin synthase
MFTGLVEQLGEIVEVVDQPPGKRLVVRAGRLAHGAAVGDSVAVNGCCLTVIHVDGDCLAFEAGVETLRRTNLGGLVASSPVNLERSLRLDDRLGGHLVTGHIDATGVLEQRHDDGTWSTMWFRFPSRLAHQLASKGSIAVDGVSLTLVDVAADQFSVALIPHTLESTTLGRLRTGDLVNLETDLLAKYVERQLQFAASSLLPSHPSHS